MLRRQQAEIILSAREKTMKSAATSVKMEHKRIRERLEKGVKEGNQHCQKTAICMLHITIDIITGKRSFPYSSQLE
jgi:ElaB/YqjD/DUF883 family membrane-anchored ribosome-binding protein